MMAIRGVLFDLDGTLMDTAPDFYVTLHELRQRYQLPRLSELTIRNRVSDGSRALTQLCFDHDSLDPDTFEQRRLELLDIYAEVAGHQVSIFPEMTEILNILDSNQIPWGIVTNKPRRYTELILERSSLNLNCKVLVCADDLSNAKPDPEGILLASRELDLNAQDILYVGDHERDIIAGKRAGCRTAAVTFGYFDEEINIDSWSADFVITSLSDFERQTKFQ